ncbi:hypothetical protein ACF0H5_020813 [Mactra antiquata]
MDCVSNKSKKKIRGLRAPRARGKRASFHGCSSIEEPPTLDPKIRKPLIKSKTESDIDFTIIPSLEIEKYEENVTPERTKIFLEPIGESSTDDVLVDDDNDVDVDDVGEDVVDTGICVVNESIELVDDTEVHLVDVEKLAQIEDIAIEKESSETEIEAKDTSTKIEAIKIEEEFVNTATEKGSSETRIEAEDTVTKIETIEIGKEPLDTAADKESIETGIETKDTSSEKELKESKEKLEEIVNGKKTFENEIETDEQLLQTDSENVSVLGTEVIIESFTQLVDKTEGRTEPDVHLDINTEEQPEKSEDFDENIQFTLEEVKDNTVESDDIAFIDETVDIEKDSEEVTIDDRNKHSEKGSDIEHSSENIKVLCEKKLVLEEDMDLPVVKQSQSEVNVDSDEELQFVAKKYGNAGIVGDKRQVKSGMSSKAHSKDEIMFQVLSEHVDQDSIIEDVNDDVTDDDDIEVGQEVLVQYMKRKQHKHLKTSLRNGGWGITNDVRSCLWYNLCHYLHKAGDTDMFSEFAEDLFSPDDYTEIGIPSFVDMDHLNSYHLSVDGIYISKQILCVLGHSNPDIIYSPVLYSILSLFLHYMDTSQCFNCLYSLLRCKDSSFLPTTKVSYEASKLVMRDLAKKYAKSGYVYLSRNCSNVDEIFDSWIWWIFEDLPMIFLVRIIDCYLQEGIKIFYRVCLAILTLFSKTHAKKSSPKKGTSGGNILTALRQFCREIPIPVHKLLKTSFGIKGLSRKEIRKLQVKHEMYINSTKLINSMDTQQKGGQLTLSKSFSGPMILQNLGSNTLTADSLYALLTWLPTRYAICQPELLYTSEEHGTSLVTLYQRVENYQPTVIIIKTTNDEVFGAFCSTYWRERRQKSHLLSYFGTGETFIFTLAPEKKKYDWVGLNDENIPNTASMFQAGDRSILTIGGGHGEAISLDEMMLHCRSERCDTFNNEPLSQSEDFVCKVVEVYGFQ